MRTYRIYFIRHGLTQANKLGQYVGVTDVPLCPEGEQQLQQLTQQYEYPNVAKIYTSPLLRCRQTADLIYPQMKKTVLPELQEYNFGIYEGKTAMELADDMTFQAWHATNMAQAPQDGEDLMEFGDRIQKGLDCIIQEMMDQHLSDVAVITHGGVIMSLFSMCGIPAHAATEWLVGNGRGYGVLVNAMLWSTSKWFEICSPLPYENVQAATPSSEQTETEHATWFDD